jgi:hypothetical protein
MNWFKSAIQTASLTAVVFALVACEDSQTTVTSEETPMNKGGVVFSEAFADAGLFTVVKSPEGEYSYSVGARIGSEAEKQLAASVDLPTLAGVYQQIHGEKSEIPAIVSEVSKLLETQAASGTDKIRATSVALAKAATESGFKTGYCRDFSEGLHYTWKPQTCIWKANSNYMGTPGVNSYSDVNDRVWVWNATPYTAALALWNTGFTAKASTWQPSIQPNWVTWFSWGGTYSNANATVKLPGTYGGELGLSNSSRYYK